VPAASTPARPISIIITGEGKTHFWTEKAVEQKIKKEFAFEMINESTRPVKWKVVVLQEKNTHEIEAPFKQ
jgi:hypothetical protein